MTLRILRKAGDPLPVPSLAVPGRVYLLHVPDVEERTDLRVRLARTGARQHGPWAILTALEEAVRAILDGYDQAARDTLVARIDGQRERLRAIAATPVGADVAAMGELLRALQDGEAEVRAIADVIRRGAAHAPAGRRFLDMEADESVYNARYGLAAAELLLDGWENGPCDFPARRPGLPVPKDILHEIPDADLDTIGLAMQHALRLTEEQKKTSGSPPPTPSGPTASPVASAPPRKTRLTKRTRGSSRKSAGKS